MFYRYEAKKDNGSWEGIFAAFDPDDRRKWYCLATPKWYQTHPDTNSRAWFTEHGCRKWHKKMEQAIEESKEKWDFETRLIIVGSLDNIVVKGKTQVIQMI